MATRRPGSRGREGRTGLALIALACALYVAAPSSSAAAARCAHANEVPTARGIPAATTAVLCLVNRERTARGLRALRASRRLDRAASRHSADMVRRGYFAHTSPDGSTATRRIAASGYLAGARGWLLGENIAWGGGRLATPAAIVAAWMHSPGHRANVLRTGFRDVGTGVAPRVPIFGAPFRGATYTQDFGRRG